MFRLALLISLLIYGVVFIGGITLYKILEVLFLVICFFITILLGITIGNTQRKSRSTSRY